MLSLSQCTPRLGGQSQLLGQWGASLQAMAGPQLCKDTMRLSSRLCASCQQKPLEGPRSLQQEERKRVCEGLVGEAHSSLYVMSLGYLDPPVQGTGV